MKKSLLALAALSAFAGVAQAQSSVTLYGTLDAGYAYQTNNTSTATTGTAGTAIAASDNSTTVSMVSSGYRQSNRWGIKGTEDMGGGLKANFNLESGLYLSNGTTTAGNGGTTSTQLFDRQSWIGLSTASTELRLGRDYTLNFKTIAGYDPMEYYYTGIVPLAGLAGTRFSNDTVITQQFGNLKVGAEYAINGTMANGKNTDLTSATAAQSNGSGYGFNVVYNDGKLNVGAAYTVVNGDPSGASLTYANVVGYTTGTTTNGSLLTVNGTQGIAGYTVGASYIMGNLKVSAGAADYKVQNATTAGTPEQQYWWGGLKYAVTPKVDARAAYYQTNTTTSTALTGTTGLWIAAVDYKLSPRTTLYVEADQQNYSGVNTLNTGITSQNRFSVGLGHTF